jgi:hypothetical protein
MILYVQLGQSPFSAVSAYMHSRRNSIIWPAAESEGERAAARRVGKKGLFAKLSLSLYTAADYANVVISLRRSC